MSNQQNYRGSKMKYIGAFIIFALVQVLPTLAEPHPLFLFRPENQAWLQYLCFVNPFDSCVTQYRFGEVSIHSNGSVTRILLSESIVPLQVVAGSTSQGEDTQLRSHAYTHSFQLTAGSQLSWFSELMTYRSPCDDNEPSGGGPNKPTAAWRLLDRSEFVVELVRKSDNVRLAVLDSIGVTPPTQSSIPLDTRYGTNPQTVVKYYLIPLSLDGIEAYLRVSPRRYGSTPLGMDLGKQENWVNYSSYYDSTHTAFITSTAFDSLSSQCFHNFLSYCDSVKLATGKLPNYEKFIFSSAEGAIFRARYELDEHISSSGQRYWVGEVNPLSKEGETYPEFTRSTIMIKKIISTITVSPNPVTTDKMTISLDAMSSVSVLIRLYTPTGEAVSNLWLGKLHSGINTLAIDVPDSIASGSYLLAVEGDDGKPLIYSSLVRKK